MLRWYDDEDGDGARAILAGMTAKQNVMLQLQAELMDGRLLKETTAGRYVVDARREDEGMLAKLRGAVRGDTISSADQEIAQLQESVEARKVAEICLQVDSTSKIRREIQHFVDEAKRRKTSLSAKEIFKWLIGISELTVQLVQTVLQA